ncbi:leucine-rich repeat domain-containing protein [uncultured Ruminococcus sp.]|uniref:leucine-rich repeat domain-containing protein n=1 Tax=uncultured Ruminococcus sp. TaxID=165186 RepID=UPI0025D3C639|nr:leucine-rich repeat domain-containing protein [uncultured Ruminococcus sp.]
MNDHGRRMTRITAFAAAMVISAAPLLSAQNSVLSGTQIVASASYEPTDTNYTQHTSGSITYYKYSDHVEVYNCTSGTTSLTIPETIDGLPVTAIARYGFQCSSLTSVTIPDSVKKIGYYAFSMSSNLTSVTLSNNLEVMEMHAFEDCNKLETVRFPGRLVKIHDKCFANTAWLTAQREKDPLVIVNGALIDATTTRGAVTVPSSVKYVSPSAFARNSDVTSVVFPTSVTEVGDNTFFMCDNLTSADIKGATYIGLMAFDYCNRLSELKLSSKLTKIDEYAFSDINSHATITFYGTRDKWESVSKPSDASFLNSATIVYDNSSIGDDPIDTSLLYPVVKTQVKDHKIGFKWTKVEGAEKYGIGVYQANKWVVKKQVDGSVTTWTSPKVSNGTYRLVVLAKVNGQWVNADVFKKSFYVTVR